MDEHKISPDMLIGRNDSLYWSEHLCSLCKFLPCNAVKTICGHIICDQCAQQILTQQVPQCPAENCAQPLTGLVGPLFFPDPYLRRKFGLICVACENRSMGCPWTGNLDQTKEHFESCRFCKIKCKYCSTWIASVSEMAHLTLRCPMLPVTCPLAEIGCTQQDQMPKSHLLEEHFSGDGFEHHMRILSSSLKELSVQADKEESIEANLGEKSRELASLMRRVDELDKAQEAVRVTLTRLDDQARKSGEIDERESRLCRLENTPTDGTMIWKISEFSRRIDDARTGRCTELTSQPFYTSLYGFKLCMKLHPVGEDNHMSLAVVLMKGEFDNILKWPFTHKITLKLFNQVRGTDVNRTIVPNPNSRSFRKPRVEMNSPTGFPRFIATRQILTDGFIKDDTIFIKAQVDPGERNRN